MLQIRDRHEDRSLLLVWDSTASSQGGDSGRAYASSHCMSKWGHPCCQPCTDTAFLSVALLSLPLSRPSAGVPSQDEPVLPIAFAFPSSVSVPVLRLWILITNTYHGQGAHMACRHTRYCKDPSATCRKPPRCRSDLAVGFALPK